MNSHMAGNPKTRERLAEIEKENAELRRQISQCQAAGTPKRSARAPRKIEEGVDVLCEEMLSLADEGLSPDEIAARWNISAQTMTDWAEAYPAFAEDLARARIRARASILATIRTSLQNGRGLPAGMLDRVLALYDTSSQRDDDAAQLVGVQLIRSVSAGEPCACCDGRCLPATPDAAGPAA